MEAVKVREITEDVVDVQRREVEGKGGIRKRNKCQEQSGYIITHASKHLAII